MGYIWIKTTKDEYELIVELADTAVELAAKCGVTANMIYNYICRSKKSGKKCIYQKVAIDENEI